MTSCDFSLSQLKILVKVDASHGELFFFNFREGEVVGGTTKAVRFSAVCSVPIKMNNNDENNDNGNKVIMIMVIISLKITVIYLNIPAITSFCVCAYVPGSECQYERACVRILP